MLLALFQRWSRESSFSFQCVYVVQFVAQLPPCFPIQKVGYSGNLLNFSQQSHHVHEIPKEMGADHNSMEKNESDTSQSPSRGGSLALVQLRKPRRHGRLHAIFKTIFSFISLSLIPCKRAALLSGPSEARSERRVLIGTLFGNRKGHVHFAVQEDPKTPPVLLLELATPTSSLVKEMKSGLVRIALECEKSRNLGKLIQEPFWTMYCNGRKTGYALRRTCSENDLRILSLLQAISMGAGVLPIDVDGSEGDLMFMRGRFERVIGSKDSEAFYMMNPDGTGGRELSIFFLRI